MNTADEGSDESAEAAMRAVVLGKLRYDLSTSNCEHFASFCARGDFRSRQVDKCMQRLEVYLTRWHTDAQLSGALGVGVGQGEGWQGNSFLNREICGAEVGGTGLDMDGWRRKKNVYLVDGPGAKDEDKEDKEDNGVGTTVGRESAVNFAQGPFLHSRARWYEQVGVEKRGDTETLPQRQRHKRGREESKEPSSPSKLCPLTYAPPL